MTGITHVSLPLTDTECATNHGDCDADDICSNTPGSFATRYDRSPDFTGQWCGVRCSR